MTHKTSFKEKLEDLVLSRLMVELEKEGYFQVGLTVSHTAKILGINKIKMYELARSDTFPSIVLGNRILIPVVPFMEWIEKTAWSKAS